MGSRGNKDGEDTTFHGRVFSILIAAATAAHTSQPCGLKRQKSSLGDRHSDSTSASDHYNAEN